jgi:hypothetical protein
LEHANGHCQTTRLPEAWLPSSWVLQLFEPDIAEPIFAGGFDFGAELAAGAEIRGGHSCKGMWCCFGGEEGLARQGVDGATTLFVEHAGEHVTGVEIGLGSEHIPESHFLR